MYSFIFKVVIKNKQDLADLLWLLELMNGFMSKQWK